MTFLLSKPNWLALTIPERIAIIRPLWADGQSGTEIAEQFINATRNAIIGAVHRAKLPDRPTKLLPKHSATRKADRARAVMVRKIAAFTQPPIEPVLNFRAPEPDGIGIDLLKLTANSCRWPVTHRPPHKFCGAPGDGTYCEKHRKMAYVVRPE